jgi:hypothetical protein
MTEQQERTRSKSDKAASSSSSSSSLSLIPGKLYKTTSSVVSYVPVGSIIMFIESHPYDYCQDETTDLSVSGKKDPGYSEYLFLYMDRRFKLWAEREVDFFEGGWLQEAEEETKETKENPRMT